MVTSITIKARRRWAAFSATVLACIATLAVIVVFLIRGRREFPYGPGILLGALAVLV